LNDSKNSNTVTYVTVARMSVRLKAFTHPRIGLFVGATELSKIDSNPPALVRLVVQTRSGVARPASLSSLE
jgi:hypothetical protein